MLDPSAPTVGAVSGPLTTDRWVRGRVDWRVDALDDNAGLRTVGLDVEGSAGSESSLGCIEPPAALGGSFDRPEPCPRSVSSFLGALDSTSIRDGDHVARVVVRDMADNRTATAPLGFRVDNTPPLPPTSLSLSTSASDPAGPPSVDLSWTTPDGQVSPIVGAVVRVCREGGDCQLRDVTGTSASGAGGLIPVDGRYRVAVQLVDEAGNGRGSFDDALALERPLVVDRRPPAAPIGLSTTSPQSQNAFDVRWTQPTGDDEVSAVAGWRAEICPAAPAGGACAQQSGTSTDGAARVTVPGPGEWTLRLWLVDEAGNASPSNAAQATLRALPASPATTTAATTTVAPPPAGPTGQAKRRPYLRLTTRTLRRGRLAVRIASSRGSTGRVTVVARYRRGGRTRFARRTLTLRGARAATSFGVGRAATGVRVRASYAGDRTFAARQLGYVTAIRRR